MSLKSNPKEKEHYERNLMDQQVIAMQILGDNRSHNILQKPIGNNQRSNSLQKL